MKKFYEIIGKLLLNVVGFIGVVAVTSIIVLTYYEDEKEELFWELSTYLNNIEEQIMEDNGIFDAKNLPDGYEITNI